MRPGLPSLSGMVSIVTGAGHGIGQSIAELFAEQGAIVIVSDRDARKARAVASSITRRGDTAEAFPCNIGRRRDVERLVRHARTHFRQIDVLVNNAFHWDSRRFEHQTWDGLQRYADVNFTGTTYLTQLVLQHMRERVLVARRRRRQLAPPGTVLFVTSVHEETVRRLDPWYSMSKRAEAGLVAEAAVAYGPYGIRVNAIAPGHTETEDQKVLAGRRTRNRYIPLRGASALPEDVAKVALLLASRETMGHVTGTTIFVDGGEHLYTEWVARLPPDKVGP